MAINDMQTPLTANDIAGVTEAREALRYLPLAMASAEITTPLDSDEITRGQNNALIAARVRAQFTGEAVIDPGDEQEECSGCIHRDGYIRGLADQLAASQRGHEQKAQIIRGLGLGMENMAKRHRRDARAIGFAMFACGGMAVALVGAFLGYW